MLTVGVLLLLIGLIGMGVSNKPKVEEYSRYSAFIGLILIVVWAVLVILPSSVVD